ncbi:hypothetical protein ACRAD_28980 (plasmid) [Acinetobacter radioresistens DSM 6976 = NBRC 102413 = CIP 103788]|nr:hypothetical protein ACRAD_28980 [Acinetobacter radioresistens DSM 6976 = NBRC 102413 = CIP 103788]
MLSTFRTSLAVDTWLLSAKILTSRVIGVEIHPLLASMTGDIALIGVEIHPLLASITGDIVLIGVEIHPLLASITGDIALIGVEIHPLFYPNPFI